jgi:hypothetical protein
MLAVTRSKRRTTTSGPLAIGPLAQPMSDADYCHQLSSLYRMFSRAQQPTQLVLPQ